MFSSPDVIWAIKSRKMRWAGRVARTGKNSECMQGFGWERECVDGIHRAEDRDRTVVNTVMNTRLHTAQRISRSPYELKNKRPY